MKLTGNCVWMALAIAVAAGLGGCDKKEKVAAYDPQIDGFMPHAMGQDALVAENQKKIYDNMLAASGALAKPAAPASAPATMPAGEGAGGAATPEAAPATPMAPPAEPTAPSPPPQ